MFMLQIFQPRKTVPLLRFALSQPQYVDSPNTNHLLPQRPSKGPQEHQQNSCRYAPQLMQGIQGGQ